jgi:hypothetical protein
MANTRNFDNFKIVAIEVLESILLEPGFISVSENRRIALAIRNYILITKKNEEIGGEKWFIEKINLESGTFFDNEELIRGFEIDPMFYMRKKLKSLFKSNLQCNFLEAFENLILIQKVSEHIMSKGDYYRTCWSLVDTFFEFLDNPILFERFLKKFRNGWIDLILKPEKMDEIIFIENTVIGDVSRSSQTG